MKRNPHLPGSAEEFITENMNLAHYVAWGFIKAAKKDDRIKFDKDDFISIAYLGLIKAYMKFDPTKGAGLNGESIKFSTYAIPVIRGEIWRQTRDNGYAIRHKRGDEAHEIDSIDRPISEGSARTLGEVTPGITIIDEEQVVLGDFLDTLSPRLRLVHKLRVLDISQEKVGEVFGISQVSASRMERYLLESARLYGQGMNLSDRTRFKAGKASA